MRNYYRLLEVSETASTEVIISAYKALSKKNHPDLFPPEKSVYQSSVMKELNIAKEILTDEKRRKAYNNELQSYKNITTVSMPINANSEKKSYKHKRKTLKHNVRTIKTWGKNKFSNKKKLAKESIPKLKTRKKIKILTGALILLAMLQIYLLARHYEDIKFPFLSLATSSDVSDKEIWVGMSINDVVKNFGIPDKHYSAFLEYKDAVIYIQNDRVIGWRDIEKNIPFTRKVRPKKITQFKIGAHKEEILFAYGAPDVKTQDVFVYDSFTLYFEESVLLRVEKIP